MSYESINELPKMVRNLPRPAKTLYMKAFNSTWEEYAEAEGESAAREKAAHEAAWAAVRGEYEKDRETGEWVKVGESGSRRSRHPVKHRQRRMNTSRASSERESAQA